MIVTTIAKATMKNIKLLKDLPSEVEVVVEVVEEGPVPAKPSLSERIKRCSTIRQQRSTNARDVPR